MRRSHRAGIVCILIAMLVSASPASAARGLQTSPKLLNLFLDYLITDADVDALAKWDLIVLDMDQQFQFPDKVRAIKRRNPKIKILAYVSSSEISDARFRGDPTSPGNQMARSVPEAWFMHHPDGTHASIWPTNSLMNATAQCPVVNGNTWSTFLGPFIRDHVMSSGLWDGVFLDAAYGDLTQSFGPNLDMNNDGLVDDSRAVDNAWRAGMQTLLGNVRTALGPDAIIMNNSSASYASLTNGVLFENFPRYGWAWPFHELQTSLDKNTSPKVSAVNTNTGNAEQPWNYKLMRYGLTSALIADGYFSFDAGDSGHHRTWWYDEYDAAIGKPIGPAHAIVSQGRGATNGLWMREFEHAVVYVNSLNEAKSVVLPGEFERLTGSQDSGTNSGAIELRTNIPPQDGLILLRRSVATDIRGSSFLNGSFVQVRALDGARQKQGFFAQASDAPGGAVVLRADIDGDGIPETIISEHGEVRWTGSRGATVRVQPFGKKSKGLLSLAVGKLDGKTTSLIVGADAGSAPSVAVLSSTGAVVRSWLAYQPLFHGGVRVATADLGGDGRAVIVTTPGVGGGSHVRFFTSQGAPARGGLFAFTDTVAAGAFVATGDVNGDGKPEILLGTGPGVTPTLKVYDRSGHVIQELALDANLKARGVIPTVADVTGDGIADILLAIDPFTL